jgi:hypothetical protein
MYEVSLDSDRGKIVQMYFGLHFNNHKIYTKMCATDGRLIRIVRNWTALMILTVCGSLFGMVLNAAFTSQLISTRSVQTEIFETMDSLIKKGFTFGIPEDSPLFNYSVSSLVHCT